jgi:hypothetical protein
MRRHCLILLKKRSTKLRALYRYGLKQIWSLRFRLGGMLAHAPCSPAKALIHSASYPRSASYIAPDFRSDNSSVTSRLSWASPVVSSRRTGIPLVSRERVFWSLAHFSTGPSVLFRPRPRNRRADGRGQWRCRSSGRSRHGFRRAATRSMAAAELKPRRRRSAWRYRGSL